MGQRSEEVLRCAGGAGGAAVGVGAVRLPHEADLVRARALPPALQRDRARAGSRERPRPGARRRGHLPGVALPQRRALESGRDRPDAAPAPDGGGDRAAHGRHGVPGQRPHEPGDQHPLRLVVPAEPLREVPQRAARARRVQRGPGQGRQLARQRPADRVRGDARVRRRGRLAQAHLPRGVARRAVPHRLMQDPILELAENANTYTPLAPTDERIVTDRFVLWMGRADHPAWNVAQRFRFRADELDEVRAEIHAAVRGRGRTGCSWEVGSSATPADLVDRLFALGLELDDDGYAVGMVLTEPPQQAPPVDIEVRRVSTPEEALVAAQIAAVAFGMAEPVPAPVDPEGRSVRYLAYVDGEPVAQ